MQKRNMKCVGYICISVMFDAKCTLYIYLCVADHMTKTRWETLTLEAACANQNHCVFCLTRITGGGYSYHNGQIFTLPNCTDVCQR